MTECPAVVRVLFDMYELSPKSGKSIGIYVYAIGLLNALRDRLPDGLKLVVACHAENASDIQLAAGPQIEVVPLLDRHPGRLRRQWWWRFGAQWTARRLQCQAYFSPKGFMPGWYGLSMGLKTCIVVHDLIPLWYAVHHPGQFGRVEECLVNRGLLRSCRYADQVIAISEATAQDIRRVGRRGPVSVIHNGLGADPLAPAPIKEDTGLVSGFILAMSSELPHKNAATILEGYRLYRTAAPNPLPMVVCGLEGDAPQGVSFVKGLPRAELVRLYKTASVFVFLSRTEGFGYPPLEAMQQGTVSICSDIPVLRETTMGNALFVDPTDPQALANMLKQCLNPSFAPTMNMLQQQGKEVTQRYAWTRTAEQVAGVLQQLVLR